MPDDTLIVPGGGVRLEVRSDNHGGSRLTALSGRSFVTAVVPDDVSPGDAIELLVLVLLDLKGYVCA